MKAQHDSSNSSHVYKQRRQRFAQAMNSRSDVNSIAIIPTAPERIRNRDSNYIYRFDSYFHYLTGFTEPNAILIVHGDGRSVLLCQAKNPERELWDGLRLGPTDAPHVLGVDAAYSVAEIDALLPVWMADNDSVYYPFATHMGLEVQIENWLGTVRQNSRQGVSCPSMLHDACQILDDMRLIKDITELQTMRKAATISAQGHVRAMQQCRHLLAQGLDVREYHLDAELLYEFRRQGSQYTAYSSIVAAGKNACILHYRADAARIASGDLVLIDAGCELDGYASDITRTFPANGRFTPEQRLLYDIVLASQHAALTAVRVGARFNDAHLAAVRVLTQGLMDVGLLNKNKVGTLDDAITSHAYQLFYMHRTSHWLGMDVHDCGNYTETKSLSNQKEKDKSKSNRILQAGMVLTIEPGLYIRPSADVPEKFHNIGIRIEDDVVVQNDGAEVISSGVPTNPEEIEYTMQQRSAWEN